MANKKNKSRQRSQPSNASRADQIPEKDPPRFDPVPPKPNLVILITSGILMVGWMIFLLVIAIS